MTKKRLSWIEVGSPVRAEPEKGIYSAAYSLSDLAEQGALKPKKLDAFRKSTRLEDYYWRAYWSRGSIIAAGGRGEFPRKTSLVVVFMHGWDGSNAIWENLPARVCANETNVLALSPDVNGFGRSPFRKPGELGYSDCNPAADMRSVEEWLQMLGLLGGRRHVPILLVGHSMSGAALFYLDPQRWPRQLIGRCALAPALLMNDALRKGFYRTLGLGIWAGRRLSLDKLTEAVSPVIVKQLISGASKAVQAEHGRIFKRTDKSTLAHTFFAMGQAKRPPQVKDWGRFKVILGHEDRLVGLTPMLGLLTDLGFNSRQLRVVLGDHYFFSVGRHSRDLHREGREIALEEICALAAECRRG